MVAITPTAFALMSLASMSAPGIVNSFAKNNAAAPIKKSASASTGSQSYDPNRPALTKAQYNASLRGSGSGLKSGQGYVLDENTGQMVGVDNGNLFSNFSDAHDAGNSIPYQGYADVIPIQRSAGMSPDTPYAEANSIDAQSMADAQVAQEQAYADKYNALLQMYGIGQSQGVAQVPQAVGDNADMGTRYVDNNLMGATGAGGYNPSAAQAYYNTYNPVQGMSPDEVYQALASIYGR